MPKRSADGIVRTVSAPMMSSMKRPRQSYKGKIKTKIPKGLKTYVAKTIRNMSEKKEVVAAGSAVLDTCTVGLAPSTLNLVPRIEQGSQQNQRTGNDVRVVGGTVRGHICLRPQNATTNPVGAPILVKMWLCRYKSANTSSILQTNADTAFFEGATGGVTGFAGTLLDLSLFPNESSWEVLETKEAKLGVGFTSAGGVSSYYDNSPSTVPFAFSIGKYLGGVTQYLDNSSSVSTNKNLFLVFQAVAAFPYTGTTAWEIAEITYGIKHQYIDN